MLSTLVNNILKIFGRIEIRLYCDLKICFTFV